MAFLHFRLKQDTWTSGARVFRNEIAGSKLGPDHPYTLRIRNNLANAFRYDTEARSGLAGLGGAPGPSLRNAAARSDNAHLCSIELT